MLYGYCRISTRQQNIERQERNILEKFKNAIIVKDTYTGRELHRPQWDKLQKQLKKGDTIVFDSVSRMSRSQEEGSEEYFRLFEMGVELVFLNEPYINTEVYKKAISNKISTVGTKEDILINAINEYLKELAREQVRLAFGQAQKEVTDLSERTKGGLETARLNGKQIGQIKGAKLNVKKKKPAMEKIKKLSKDFNGNNTDKECIAIIGINRNTFYKYKKELKEEM